jgi:hypothetical protein
MKKFFILLTAISFAQILLAMEPTSSASATGPLGRATQTLYDKLSPTKILDELHRTGLSSNKRVRMTQMHRLDRIVPLHIESKETEKLCDDLTDILTHGYPLGSGARDMAHEYLWQLRPVIGSNIPLLARVIATLDLLNPAQIIDDLRGGHIYIEAPIELENRLNRSLERLIQLKRTELLQQLIETMASRRPMLLPGKRVLQLAYAFLRAQEKENTEKKRILVATFGAEKSASDTEE